MNPLGTLQQTASDAIKASPWFSAIPVLIDNGDVDGAISKGLESPGVVVVVGLPLTVKRRDQTGNKTYSDAILDVDFLANPTQATGLNLPEGLGELIKSLAGFPVLPQRDGFEIGDALAQSLSEGLIHWTLPISRRVSLAA